MKRASSAASLLAGAVMVLVIAGTVEFSALGRLLEIGSCEHYEVTKAWLWANGHPLYREIWNDQPALLTVMLGLAFKAVGPSMAIARMVAVGFGISLVLALAVVVRRRCGLATALLAGFCLLAAPEVLVLGVSTMLEVPAVGTALWALWPILQWEQQRRRAWLGLSGGVLATALHIKLTALLAAPALLTELLSAVHRTHPTDRLRGSFRAVGVWVGSLVAVYFALGALVGTVPWQVLWASHFSSGTRTHAATEPGPGLWSQLWGEHPEALWAGSAGLAMTLLCRNFQGMIFPLVWLGTVGLTSLWHRPWWPYYYVHLAVPLAWVASYGIIELWRLAWDMAGKPALGLRWLVVGASLAFGCGLLAWAVGWGLDRLRSEVAWIQARPRVEDSVWIDKMRQYADRTRWVYTRHTIHVFHAGLLVVPELAVLPGKRFWSGQITRHQIWATIQRYHPEQLLLDSADFGPGTDAFLQAGYRLAHAEEGLALYVATALAGP